MHNGYDGMMDGGISGGYKGIALNQAGLVLLNNVNEIMLVWSITKWVTIVNELGLLGLYWIILDLNLINFWSNGLEGSTWVGMTGDSNGWAIGL